MEVGNQGLRREIKGTNAKEGKKVKGRNEGCRMCSGATQNIEGENKKVRERKDDGDK